MTACMMTDHQGKQQVSIALWDCISIECSDLISPFNSRRFHISPSCSLMKLDYGAARIFTDYLWNVFHRAESKLISSAQPSSTGNHQSTMLHPSTVSSPHQQSTLDTGSIVQELSTDVGNSRAFYPLFFAQFVSNVADTHTHTHTHFAFEPHQA
jgi:hypothetical protein